MLRYHRIYDPGIVVAYSQNFPSKKLRLKFVIRSKLATATEKANVYTAI